MSPKVEIKFTATDEFENERTLTYTQNNIYTTEDLEHAFVKAALSWGFDDYFFGYTADIFKKESH